MIPFTEETVDKILKACRLYRGANRDKLVVLTDLLLAAGLRIGDAAMISKDRIVKTKEGWSVELRTAKTGTAVSCPIPNSLAKSIIGLDATHPFWSGKSDMEAAAKNWRKIYARIFKTAGIDGHPHQFRHTFAKRLLSRGIPVGYVASPLGNTEKIVQKHYAKWIVERQTAVDKAVRDMWSRPNSATPTLHQRY